MFEQFKELLIDEFQVDESKITLDAELSGDLLSIGYEGDAFPDDEIVDALKPFFCEKSWGKLDVIDLEAWTLHRYTFTGGQLNDHIATLDKALDPCALH